jgi:hypothetical protein
MMFVVMPTLFIIPRLVNWVFGRTILPLWLPIAVAPAALIGGSLYLDAAGVVTPVKVTDKREVINIRDGGWNRSLSVGVNYQAPGEVSSTPISLGCDPDTFDSLRVGQTVEARVLDLGRYFRFARLKNRSTFSLLGKFMPREPRGPWRQGTAVVRQVTRVTEYTHRRSAPTVLPWPFDIIQLEFTPEGRPGPVTAVDVVDVKSEAGVTGGLAQGAVAPISWPEDDPRSAKIVGARPGRTWANWWYDLFESIGIIVITVIFLGLAGYLWKRLWRSRRMNGNAG